MKKKDEISPVDRDAAKWIKEDPEFAKAYFEELAAKPVAIQLATLRRLRGVTQEQMAAKLHVHQAYVSKLERPGTDHLLSNYEKAAKLLHGHLAIIPDNPRVK